MLYRELHLDAYNVNCTLFAGQPKEEFICIEKQKQIFGERPS